MPHPWMLLRLADETSAYHVAADHDRLSLMDVKTPAEYQSSLARIYGLESAVEETIIRVTDLDPDVMRDRLRGERLRHDLLTLGVAPERLAWAPRLTHVPIRTTPQALGWLFVLERTTLMAGLIRRELQRVFGESLCGAARYLSAPGDTPGASFRVLGEWLDHYARRYTTYQIVEATIDAFRVQRQWYYSCPLVDLSERWEQVGHASVPGTRSPLPRKAAL